MSPKVSVCIFTYNHIAYIAQAIESVLAQKTNFDIEILIGEDDSTDGTRAIVQRYAEQHPDIIRPLYHSSKDKIFINGRMTGRKNFMVTLGQAKGEYIALLDGDDFWTNETKLQQQVDFLDAHQDYCLCFHNAIRTDESGLLQDRPVIKKSKCNDFSMRGLLRGNVIPTMSCMVRNPRLKTFPDWYLTTAMGDWPFYIIVMAMFGGKAHYLPFNMAAYRMHGGGVWSEYRNMSYKNRLAQIDVWQTLIKNGEPWADPVLLRQLIDKNYRRIIKFFMRKRNYPEARKFLAIRTGHAKKRDWFYFKTRIAFFFMEKFTTASRQ